MNASRNHLMSWLVVALLAVLAGQWLLADPGAVLVRFRGYDYTTTVAAAVIWTAVALFALWLLVKLVTLPFRSWRAHRDRRARARLGEGLEALHRGHYDRAGKLLVAAADESDIEAGARLAAVRAAIARGDHAAANAQLAALGERHATERAIAAAELALDDHRPTDALVALDAPAAQPLPPRGLALRALAFAANGQAAQAYGLLGTLRQQQALPPSRLDELQERWAAGLLREADDANVLAERWERLPKSLRAEPIVAGAYAERAAALNWDEAATRAIEQALDTRWDEGLAARYGTLPVTRLEQRRAAVDRWLRDHPSSPALLLARARLARAQGDWPDAEASLHRAIAQGAGADAWEELGHGLAAHGDDALARQCYANALRAARGEDVAWITAPQDDLAAPVLRQA
ncbi:MAG TPA: heme biosynthesis HemY N-terminal domain-containing protein [Luteimonas sp.]|nr:heme biosynthesis HemY N-terminal domain-containing protein [Luteimonas sp.]